MKRLLSLLLWMLVAAAPALAGDGPHLNDFARMIPLTVSGDGALYELILPADVYTGAYRSDLRDLAVFNGGGEIVPFALMEPPPADAIVERRQLPLFPLSGETGRRPDNLSLQVRTDADGAIVNLVSTPGTGTQKAVTSYVVDATRLDRAVSGFDLDLLRGGNEYVGRVGVATSDDLHHWREYADGALATLASGTQQLHRSRIEFPGIKARYFRLTLCPELEMPHLSAAFARLESAKTATGRATARYGIAPVKGERGAYRVLLNGRMPVDRLRLAFDAENSLAGITFFSRIDDKSAWTERGTATFYRLNNGTAVAESPPLEIAPTTDREWLLRLRQPGSINEGKLPMLEIGWQARRLIFVARGEPPFRLAFRSARTGDVTLSDDSVATTLASLEKQQVRPLPVRAGTTVESGGEKALRPIMPVTTWKKLSLWGALLSVVLLLARMAWSLTKEMKLGQPQNNSTKKDLL